MKKERKLNTFTWEPPRPKFSPWEPPKDTRIPKLWIAIDQDKSPWLENYYLVNNSGETLSSVRCGQGGFISFDEETAAVGRDCLDYSNVLQGEAVKFDEYHKMLDSDFMLQWSFAVRSEKLGEQTFKTELSKGGLGEFGLLW